MLSYIDIYFNIFHLHSGKRKFARHKNIFKYFKRYGKSISFCKYTWFDWMKALFCSEVKTRPGNHYFDATISAYVAAQLITAPSPKQTEFVWKPRGISRCLVERSDWLRASGSGQVTWTHLAFWDTNSARYEKLDHSGATNVCVKRSGRNGSSAPPSQN